MIEFEAELWGFEDLARRLADLIYGSKSEIFLMADSSWSLGTGNNVWLYKGGKEYKLIFRYPILNTISWVTSAIKDVIQKPNEYIESH